MAILVTGGAGFIGSHMVWYLVDSGEEVVVLDDLSTGFEWLLPGSIDLQVGDVGDQQLLDKIFKSRDISSVIHFAGSVIVPESVSNPIKYYGNNSTKSLFLIEACIRNGIKNFVFSSTAAVYGESKVTPITENTPLKPISPYGYSKLITEKVLHDASVAHDFCYVVLRYFNVAGADPSHRTGQTTKNATHLIKVACEVALGKRDKLEIFGTDYDTPDGTAIRDYIHVWDLVDAHYQTLKAMEEGAGSEKYNCGYGTGHSVREVIDSVKRLSANDFKVEEVARRVGDSPNVVADSSLIRKSLNWQPSYGDLDTIVSHALEWENKLAMRNAD